MAKMARIFLPLSQKVMQHFIRSTITFVVVSLHHDGCG
jgi:hypothetical protein